MSDFKIPATVSLGKWSVPVLLQDTKNAEILAKCLASGAQVKVMQVFSAPAEGEEETGASLPPAPSRKRNGATVTSLQAPKKAASATSGQCRGVALLPDEEHGPPGRGQAHGFCPLCIKKIPRALRLDLYEKAKAGKSGVPVAAHEPDTGDEEEADGGE